MKALSCFVMFCLLAAIPTVQAQPVKPIEQPVKHSAFFAQSLEQMDTQAAILYPTILSDRIEVILSLPNQPKHHYSTPISRESVETAIDRMRQSMRRTAFPQERLSVANQIYTWLIQPIEKDLANNRIKTLVFVLDGSLSNIPMAALYDGNKYLIEKYQIAISPNLQLFHPQPHRNQQLKVFLGGISEGNQQFSALPGVKQEINQINGKISAEVLLNKQFTTQAVKNIFKRSPVSIIHLATHGQFSSKAEETFILTWDGRISIEKLNKLLLKRKLLNLPQIELLVLSACQTAKGDKRASLGMAGAAVRSGVGSTLATMWTVSDVSTATFMKYFYQELLKEGISKAEAVRRSQIKLLKQREFENPYYWAPFVLIGNWL